MTEQICPLSRSIQTAPSIAEFMAMIESRYGPKTESDVLLVKRFFTAAEAIVARMSEMSPFKEQGRKGCVIGIVKLGEDTFADFREVGDDRGGKTEAPNALDREKRAKHTMFAVGKTVELVQHPDALSSREIYDEKEGDVVIEDIHDTWRIPGCAIRIGEHIIVVSGYPDGQDDEAVGLAIAQAIGMRRPKAIERFARQIQNTRYAEIKDKLFC